MRRVLSYLAALCAVVVGVAFTVGAGSAEAAAPPGTPTAVATDGVATVGPLFTGSLSAAHSCTASVIDSPAGDLILTAAHCVDGSPKGWLFAPGYDNGATPYGVWTVQAAYFDPHWLADQNPKYDYVLLQVAPDNGTEVEDVTGGEVLATAPWSKESITDVAYNAGQGGQAITCTVPTYRTDGYPSFNCDGYVGGSSGSPWLATLPHTGVTLVQGVIGGLHQGGCYSYTSYSSPFTPAVYALLWRADHGVGASAGPNPGSDGC